MTTNKADREWSVGTTTASKTFELLRISYDRLPLLGFWTTNTTSSIRAIGPIVVNVVDFPCYANEAPLLTLLEIILIVVGVVLFLGIVVVSLVLCGAWNGWWCLASCSVLRACKRQKKSLAKTVPPPQYISQNVPEAAIDVTPKQCEL